uniref:Uncharacterized protein LOC114914421 n=1 Tax=Elaeis guineensis var. tenera TaxID=51953 RepID=A0A8N4EZ69_ELAGV|nr:uncharacterized protein LOC114914421 [Elaeis guineensis]
MAPTDDTRSAGRVASSDVQVSEGASALANHNLARRLCQATILPADRELLKDRPVSDMLSAFYPTMIQLIYSISELEAGYRRFGDVQAVWKNRAETVEVEKATLVDQLKLSVDREARLEEEISRLTNGLAASEAELQSAREQIQRKTRSVHRLRRERDGCVRELEAEREQLRISLENLAKAEENLSSAQADADIAKAESAKEALIRAVEDFRGSDEYREELLESGFASYRVGYEDARDAIQSLHPELDLSGIVPPGSEDQAAEEEADPLLTERVAEGEAATTSDPSPTRAGTPVALELYPVQEVDTDE